MVEMYYSLNPKGEFFTLDEIGDHVGKTRETIRQGIKRALEKLIG